MAMSAARIFLVICLAVVPFSGMARVGPCAGAVPRSGQRTPLVWVGGKPITVKYLTSVGYQRGLAICGAAFRMARVRKWNVLLTASFLPMPSRWLPPPHGRARSFYAATLREVVLLYLCHRLLVDFDRKYHPKTGKYVNRTNLSVELAQISDVWNRYDSLIKLGILAGWTTKVAEGHKVPGLAKSPTWRDIWPVVLRDPAFFLSGLRCFPYLNSARGKPTEWAKDAFTNGVANIEIYTVMMRNMPHFVSLADDRLGIWRFFLCLRVASPARSLPPLRKLLLVLADSNGNTHLAKLSLANQVLETLGSPTSVIPFHGWKSYISKTFRIPQRRLVPMAFLPVHRRQASPSFIFFRQTMVPKYIKDHYFGPGSEVFSVAERALLRPLAVRLLAGTRFNLGIKPLTPRKLVNWINCDTSILKSFFGKKFPVVIKKNPWPDPAVTW